MSESSTAFDIIINGFISLFKFIKTQKLKIIFLIIIYLLYSLFIGMMSSHKLRAKTPPGKLSESIDDNEDTVIQEFDRIYDKEFIQTQLL